MWSSKHSQDSPSLLFIVYAFFCVLLLKETQIIRERNNGSVYTYWVLAIFRSRNCSSTQEESLLLILIIFHFFFFNKPPFFIFSLLWTKIFGDLFCCCSLTAVCLAQSIRLHFSCSDVCHICVSDSSNIVFPMCQQFSFLCWMHLVICIMQTCHCFLGKKCAVVILCCSAFHKFVCSCFIFCPSCYVDKLVD